MAGMRDRRGILLGRCRWAAAALVACLLALCVLAPAVMAGGPAQGQYSLNTPSAGGTKANATGGRVGGSGGGSALPVLIVGAVVVASGAVALAYVRHRRQSGEVA